MLGKNKGKDGETLTMLEQFSQLRKNSINGVADAGNDHTGSITELEDTHNPDQPINIYNQAGGETLDGKRFKGFYDSQTGETYLNLPNIKSAKDYYRTKNHEYNHRVTAEKAQRTLWGAAAALHRG